MPGWPFDLFDFALFESDFLLTKGQIAITKSKKPPQHGMLFGLPGKWTMDNVCACWINYSHEETRI